MSSLCPEAVRAITPRIVKRALLASTVGLLTLLACNRPNWDTPVAAYLSISRALQKGDVKLAWSGLSQPTRQVLEHRADEIQQTAGGERPDPAALMLGGTPTSAQVREVKVVKEEGNVATLSVVPVNGPAQDVRMVKEQEGWKLDLSGMLQK